LLQNKRCTSPAGSSLMFRLRDLYALLPPPGAARKGARAQNRKWLWIGTFGVLAALTPAAISWAANLSVSQRDLKFSQSSISIQQGDTISFINNDNISHNISVRGALGDDTEDLGIQKPKVIVSYKFLRKQIYSVVCSVHPSMRLRVIVN
jgi:plastocyanin